MKRLQGIEVKSRGTIAEHALGYQIIGMNKLNESLRLNGVSNVIMHRLALGSNRYESRFAPPVHGNSGTGRLKSEARTSSSHVIIQVHTGDQLLNEDKRTSTIKIVRKEILCNSQRAQHSWRNETK